MKKILTLFIALILVAGIVSVAKSTDIDTTSAWGMATAYSRNRHIVQSSNGTIVVVYLRGSGTDPGLRAKKSTNFGSSWTNLAGGAGSTQIDSTTAAYSSICIDANDNIYVVWMEGGVIIRFMKLIYSAGSWSLGTERTVVSTGDNANPDIIRESGGRIWVAYGYDDGTPAGVRATRSDNEFQSAGTSYDVHTENNENDENFHPALTIRNGYPFLVYGRRLGSMWWSFWNGSSWSESAQAQSLFQSTGNLSVTMVGSDVHVVGIYGADMEHTYYNGSVWSLVETIRTAPIDDDEWPSLTTDDVNLWCFASIYYEDSSSSYNKYNIKYLKRTGSTWGGTWTAITSTDMDRFAITPSISRQKIPLAWTRGSGSPYTVKFDYSIIIDTIPPAAINDLSGQYSTGDVILSWSTPGDNGGSGTLPEGSGYRLDYSSVTKTWDKDDYEVWIPTNGVAPTTEVSYTVASLQQGTSWYFRIWTRDEAFNWSGDSNLATVWIPAPSQTYTWTGLGALGDWDDTDNWSGGPTYPNAASDKAIINTGSESINTGAARTIGQLELDSSYSGILTLGGNLTLDSSGEWNGSLTISNASTTLDLIGYNLTIPGTFSNNGTLKLQGGQILTFTNDTNSGTFEYVGNGTSAGDYTIKAFTGTDYYHLTINSTLGVTDTFRLPTSNLIVAGDFTLSSGTFTTNDGTTDRNLTVGGSVDIIGTFTANNSTITCSYNWNSSSGTFNYNASTVELTGTGNLTTAWAYDFYNLKCAAADKITTLQDGIYLINTLTLGTGTLTGPSHSIVMIKNSGTPLINGGATVTLYGINYNVSNGTITVAGGTYGVDYLTLNAGSSNVTYNLGGDMTITGTNIFSLYATDGATNVVCNTQDNDLTANRLRFGSSSSTGTTTFNCGTSTIDIGTGGVDVENNGGSHTLNLSSATVISAGNWELVDGTGNITQIPGTSTVTLDDTSGTQTVTSNSQSFYHLEIDNTGTSVQLQDAADINGGLNVATGTLDLNNYDITISSDVSISGSGLLTCSSGEQITVGGNWSASSGATFTASSSTVTFNASSGTKNILSSGTTFYNLVITTATTTATYELSDELYVQNNFTLLNGTFDTNDSGNYVVNVGSSVYINGGTFEAGASTITCGANWDSSGGTFNYDTSTVDLTGTGNLTTPGGYDFYNLTCAAADKITTLQDGILLAGTLTLGSGTLTDGASSYSVIMTKSSGTPLINGGATVTLYNIQYNVNNGTITVAGGNYGVTYLSLCAGSSNVTFNLGGNMTITGTGTFSPYAVNGATNVVCNTQNYDLTANRLWIGDGGAYGSTTLNCGTSTIDIGTGGVDMTTDGGSHTLNLSSATVTCAGNWELVDGTGNITQNPGTSTVTLDDTSGTQTVTSNNQSFYHLVIDNTGTEVQLQDAADIDGGLNVATGTLDLNSFDITISSDVYIDGVLTCSATEQITVGGNWDSSAGTFNYGNSTIDLTGTGNFKTATALLYNLTCATTTKTTTLQSDIHINNTLTLGNGALTDGDGSSYGVSLYKNSGTPLINGGATVTLKSINYYVINGTITVAGGNYGINILFLQAGSSNVTYNLGGNITVNGLFYPMAVNGATNVVCNTQNNNITAGTLGFGHNLVNGSTTLNLGTSTIDIGIGGVIVADAGGSHTLNLSSATVTCEGNWQLLTGTGTITQIPGTSTVTFDNASSTSTLTGSTTFYGLVSTASGKNVKVSSDTVIGVTNHLNFENITLRSTSGGATWYLNLSGTQDVSGVDVRDSNASGSTDTIIAFTSTDSGNNTEWDFGPPEAITDLTGECDSGTGDVTLSWSTPGDDYNWQNTLVDGSKYRIDYSSYSIAWSTSTFDLDISTHSVAPHTEVSRTITGLTTDTTWYFQIWTQDEVPLWSGLSNGATVWVEVIVATVTVSAYTDGTPDVPPIYTQSTGNCLGTFKFGGTGTISELTITEYGTCDADGELENVKLYKDDGDGNWESGDDTQLGSPTDFDVSDKATFSFSLAASTYCYVHVILDVESNADSGNTVGIELYQDDIVCTSTTTASSWPVQLETSMIIGESTSPSLDNFRSQNSTDVWITTSEWNDDSTPNTKVRIQDTGAGLRIGSQEVSPDTHTVLLMHLNLNDTTDYSGHNNHGTREGEVGWISTDTWKTGGSTEPILYFDGDNDYINCGNSSSLNTPNATISAWIRLDPTATTRNIVARDSHVSGLRDFQFRANADDTLQFLVFVGNIFYYADSTASIPEDGTWTHVAGTYDGETIRCYINGIPDGTNTDPSGNMDNDGGYLSIGARILTDTPTFSEPFNGLIDEVRVLDRALTADEIAADYYSGLFKYSKDAGVTWYSISGSTVAWSTGTVTGVNGSTSYETIYASNVPFNQYSETENKIKFLVSDTNGNIAESSEYIVMIGSITVSAHTSGTPDVPPIYTQSTGNCLGTFKFGGTGTISELTITEYGTCDADGELENVKLYKDDGDGNWESGQDTQIGSPTNFNVSDKATFSFSLEASTYCYVHVILDVESNSDSGGTVGIELYQDDIVCTSTTTASSWPVQLETSMIIGEDTPPSLDEFRSQKSDDSWITTSEWNDDSTPNTKVRIQDTGAGLRIGSAEVSPDTHTVLLMHLNLNDTTDYSGHNNHGTREGGVGWISTDTWKTGESTEDILYFDGSDDYIEIPDDDSLSFGDGLSDSPFSISAWVNFNDATSNAFVSKMFGEGGTANGNCEWLFATTSDDYLRFRLYDWSGGEATWTTSDSTLTSYENSWIHIVGTYNGSGSNTGLKLYLNGLILNSTGDGLGSYTAMHNTDTKVAIGVVLQDYPTYRSYLSGMIDEVRVLDRVLTADEVAADYYSGLFKYSKDGGINWYSISGSTVAWSTGTVTGTNGSTSYETIYASNVPFNQYSETENKIKFLISDTNGNIAYSSEYIVMIGSITVSAYTDGNPDVPPSTVGQGTTENCLGTFKFDGTGTISSMTITEYGTSDADGELENVELFKDDGDGNWESGQDTTLLGSTTNFNSSDEATFSEFSLVASTYCYVHVVLDVKSTAQVDNTIGIELYQNNIVCTSTTTASSWPVQLSSSTIKDATAPAAITDLTGLCDSGTGDVTLSWSTPGDDGWNNTLVSGSKYRIDYSSYSIQWSTNTYDVEISTSGVAPHTEVSRTITGLQDSTTWYFQIWTRDEVANWSGLSNGATVWVGVAGPSTYTWTDGAEDGDWTNSNNWSGAAGYPIDADDKAVINTSTRTINTPASALTIGELELSGSYSGTLTLGNNLTLDDSGAWNGNLTISAGTLDASGATEILGETLTVSSGTFSQGSANLTVSDGQATGTAVTVGADGTWSNTSTGNITLGAAVSNAGTITLDGDGADPIIIASSDGATQRNWQGSGSFNITDVNVSSQTCTGGTPAKIYAVSSTNGGNNTNWVFLTSVRYWVGGAGNWSDAANHWSATSGGAAGATKPGTNDTAIFDVNSGTETCTINEAVNIKGLLMKNTYSGTIAQGANTITIGADNAVFSGGTFTGGSATITMNGTMTISGTAFTSTSGTLQLESTYTVSSGSFVHNSGRIYFSAPSDVTITPGTDTYYRVEFDPTPGSTDHTISGTLYIAENLTVGGWGFVRGGTIKLNGTGDQIVNCSWGTDPFVVYSALVIDKASGGVTLGDSLRMRGAVTIDGLDSLNLAGHTLYIDDVPYTNNTTFTVSSTGTLTFEGSGATITPGTNTYYNVTFECYGTKTISGTFYIAGNLYKYQFQPLTGGTIELNGTSNQTINANHAPAIGSAVVISNSGGVVSLINATTITMNNLTINAGSIFNVNGKNLSSSNFTNNGTLRLQGGESVSTPTNNPGSTVEYTATSGSRAIKNWTYQSLKINGADGTFTLGTGETLGENLIVSTGTFDLNGFALSISSATTIEAGAMKTSTNTVTFGNGTGDDSVNITGGELHIESDDTSSDIVLNLGSGSWSNTGGTIIYDGSTVDTDLLSSLSPYNNLTINSAGSTYTLDGDITVNGDLTINDGTLDTAANNYAISVGGDWNRAGGTFTVNNSTVTFITASSTSTLTGSTTFYGLVSTASGKNVKVSSDTVIYVTNHLNFENITLRSTLNGATWYLNLSGDQDVHDVDVRDSNASGGDTIYAMSSTDSGNNTNWIFDDSILTWDGSESTDWDTAANWNFNIVPLSTHTVIIPNVATNDPQLNSNVIISSITIQTGGQLSLNERDISVSNDVYISGSLLCSNTEQITIGGNWSAYSGATVTASSSTVTFNASSGTKNILSSGTTFYNLVITTNTTTATYELSDELYVQNNFTLLNGTFDTNDSGNYVVNVGSSVYINGGTFEAGASTITCGANWDSSGGTFNYDQSTVDLTGTGNLKTIGGWSTNFYNLKAAKSGKITTILSDVGVADTLTLGSGTLTGPSYDVVLKKNGGTPLSLGNATITLDVIIYRPSSGTVTVTGGDYGTLNYLRLYALSSNVTFNLADNVKVTGAFWLTASNGAIDVVCNTQDNNLTANRLYFGYSTVKGSTTLNCGSSIIDIGASGLDMANNGGSHTFNLNSATVACAGNWQLLDGTGSIDQNWGTSTVTFDGTGTSTLTGSTTFYVLVSTTTENLTVQVSSDTVIYVTNHLNFENITLRSTLNGATWYLNLSGSGTQDVSGVDVRDSNASGGDTIVALNSTDSGNNTNWDFGPPAAITDLAGQCDSDTGDVTLSWSTPGDDGWNKTLVDGSKYRIDYSSYSIAWSTNTYDVDIPTHSVTPHTEVSYTITGLTGGTTWYFQIWTADEIPLWSDLSNGCTVWVNPLLSVSISTDTYNFGTIDCGTSTVSGNIITVTNDSNVTETYSVKCSSTTKWTPEDTPGQNEFTLQSAFHSSEPADSDLVWETDDILTESLQTCTTAVFSIDGTEHGKEVPPFNANTRKLWYRLKTPLSTSTTDQQNIIITISAEQSP